MILTWSIALYFAVALLIGFVSGTRTRGVSWFAAAPFAVHLIAVAALAGDEGTDGRIVEVDWIPSLGVTLGVRVDIMSLVLTAVVAGVGLLIVTYSSRYFSDDRRHRFLALLLLFTGGMAGIVVSDNIFGLFVFWEITTVASFLLIGFEDEKPVARAAAVQAVLVTTAGGLAMLGGLVLLALQSGTTSIAALVAAPPGGTTASVALGLILVGAFSKSAQVPFHFWLPGAMAAPTPASAYLHSATMVKAGIVLLLVLAPGFAEFAIWSYGVTVVGLATMSVGALQAMRQHDLKLLLAHGTVSQLGFMVALIGLGLTGAALGLLVAHAAFKATLFLVVGIIDKKTGTRDIRHLSGIRETSPGLALVAAAATLSMAGIPPLIGFVTKEAAFDALIEQGRWWAVVVIALASVLTVAYSARFWWGAFEEQPGGVDVAHLGEIDRPLLAGPAVLTAVTIGLGLFPGPLAEAVVEATGDKAKLVLWPGFGAALAMSAVVIAGGAAVHVISHRTWSRSSWWTRLVVPVRLPDAQRSYRRSVAALNRTADAVTGFVQSGSLPVYIAVILTTIFGVTGAVWLMEVRVGIEAPLANGPAEIPLAIVVAAAAVAATRVQRRMAAALMLGAAGFGVAGIYVAYGAPDLALTQLLIEVFAVALFAFVLARLPRRFGSGPASLAGGVRLAIAALAGVFVTGAALLVTAVSPGRSVSGFYADNAVEAGGRNIVNVILTDFRALDTLGEITVLAAAAIGVGALVVSVRSRPDGAEVGDR